MVAMHTSVRVVLRNRRFDGGWGLFVAVTLVIVVGVFVGLAMVWTVLAHSTGQFSTARSWNRNLSPPTERPGRKGRRYAAAFLAVLFPGPTEEGPRKLNLGGLAMSVRNPEPEWHRQHAGFSWIF